MDNELQTKCFLEFYRIFPVSRKIVLDTFDKSNYDLTRTQQHILLALEVAKTLSMSHLASMISTSNEQATRAVAQLVDKGYIRRKHSVSNRRIINIQLTDKAQGLLKVMKNDMHQDMINKFARISDEEMEKMYQALIDIDDVLRKVEI